MEKNTESGGTPSEAQKSAKRSEIAKKPTEKSSKDKSHVVLRNTAARSGGTTAPAARGKPHTISRPPDTVNGQHRNGASSRR